MPKGRFSPDANTDFFAASPPWGRNTLMRPALRFQRRICRRSAFYPPGPDPQWVYIADTDAVLRFPYHSGDLAPRGEAETVV